MSDVRIRYPSKLTNGDYYFIYCICVLPGDDEGGGGGKDEGWDGGEGLERAGGEDLQHCLHTGYNHVRINTVEQGCIFS